MNKLSMRALHVKTWVLPILALVLTVTIQAAFGAGSPPTDAVSVTPTWRAQLLGEQVGFDATRRDYPPFEDSTDDPPPPPPPPPPPHRYLRLTDEQIYTVPNYNGTMQIITTITTITQTDKKTGERTQTQTTQVTEVMTVSSDDLIAAELGLTLEEYYAWVAAYHGASTIISEVEKLDPGKDANDTSPHIYTLSDLYTPEVFVKDLVGTSDDPGWVPAFKDTQNSYTPDVNSAYLHLPEDELTCSLYKLKYKWNAGDQEVGTVVWDEQFTPDDGSDVQHHVKSWTGSGESPVFTIDPANYQTDDTSTTAPQSAAIPSGTYQVIPVKVEFMGNKKNLTTRLDQFPEPVGGLEYNAYDSNIFFADGRHAWNKVICVLWNNAPRTIDLIDHVQGADRATLKAGIDFVVNGQLQDSSTISMGQKPDDDSCRPFFVKMVPKGGGDAIDHLIITLVPPETKTKFDAWYAVESTAAGKAWFAELPPMPTGLEVAPALLAPDRNFPARLYYNPTVQNTFMHPDARFELRGNPTPGGHAHQVCFTASGALILSGVSAGSADKQASFSATPPIVLNPFAHVNADVTPFVWSLQLDGNPCDRDFKTLTRPMLYEGANIGKYFECRPAVPNNKPRFVPGKKP